MKKFLVLLVFASLILVYPPIASGASVSKADIAVNLEEYFQYRERSFLCAKSGKPVNEATLTTLSVDNIIRVNENTRVSKLLNMANDWGVKLGAARSSFGIKGIRQEKDLLYVTVYEWTFFDYICGPSLIDTAGYGFDHHLVFSIEKGGKLCLLEDRYDEGPLTGMCTMEKSVEEDQIGETEGDSSIITSTPQAVPAYAYNPSQAARYACKFVYPQATRENRGESPWVSFYNRDYKTTGSRDCCNFVSQAAYFGGLPFTSSWCYDDKGTRCNDTSHTAGPNHECTQADEFSNGWGGVGFLKSSFVGTYGTLSNNPSDSNIKTGDIVQYDWETDNLWDHSVIVKEVVAFSRLKHYASHLLGLGRPC